MKFKKDKEKPLIYVVFRYWGLTPRFFQVEQFEGKKPIRDKKTTEPIIHREREDGSKIFRAAIFRQGVYKFTNCENWEEAKEKYGIEKNGYLLVDRLEGIKLIDKELAKNYVEKYKLEKLLRKETEAPNKRNVTATGKTIQRRKFVEVLNYFVEAPKEKVVTIVTVKKRRSY